MKALFIGGHVDEELCFAGTLRTYKKPHYIVVSNGTSNHDEFSASCNMLGCSFEVSQTADPQRLADFFYSIRNNYDIVFTHSVNDRHPIHKMVAEASLRIFNQSLITYIGPWNGEEQANYFVELDRGDLEDKIQILSSYQSQAHRTYMQPDFIRSWARYNGIKCGKLYAEGFKVVRLVQNL